MAIKLYVIPGSHPSKAAELMLDHKGLGYKRVDLVTALHRPTLRMLGFPGKTVPALNADGRKEQGTRAISRALDELEPSRPLHPSADATEAERWGDETLQPIPRRLAWWALVNLPGAQRTEAARRSLRGYRVGLPIGLAARTVGPIAKVSAGYNEATDEAVSADLAALPGALDRVDALLAEGVIGGDELNAADFQIATSVRLLLAYEDLTALVDGRPAADHARRVVRDYDAHFPRVFPAEWLPDAKRSAA